MGRAVDSDVCERRMSASRKGLRRYGLSRYIVPGKPSLIIEKDRAWRWFVRPRNFPDIPGGFFSMEFRRLYQARAYAESETARAA